MARILKGRFAGSAEHVGRRITRVPPEVLGHAIDGLLEIIGD